MILFFKMYQTLSMCHSRGPGELFKKEKKVVKEIKVTGMIISNFQLAKSLPKWAVVSLQVQLTQNWNN